mgnify:CR=1 FL=1
MAATDSIQAISPLDNNKFNSSEMDGNTLGVSSSTMQTVKNDVAASAVGRIAFQDDQPTKNIAHQLPRVADVNTQNALQKQLWGSLSGLAVMGKSLI